MTADATSKVQPTVVARVGTQLPYHEDVAERTILAIITLWEKLRALETLEPDPISGSLFNQLFDLVTMSKMTTRQEEQVSSTSDFSHASSSYLLTRLLSLSP